MSIYYVHAGDHEDHKSVQTSGTRAIGNCKSPFRFWDSNSSPQ